MKTAEDFIFRIYIPATGVMGAEFDLRELAEIIPPHDRKTEIWMQGSDFRDKNEKRIFDGDIIGLINADGEYIKAICEQGIARRRIFENTVDIPCFYFKIPNGKKTFPIVHNYAGKHDLELFEIIGNIHENPDLITQRHYKKRRTV